MSYQKTPDVSKKLIQFSLIPDSDFKNSLENEERKPLISCLMSVYNGEEFLVEAIQSILNQTVTDFELLIVNDCSTDNTNSILQSFSNPRIRVLQNNENIGLTKSLNKGIEAARGKYIARLDADDISLPDRFERQLASIKGGFVCLDSWKQYEVPIQLLFENVFIHSGAFFENKVRYQESTYYAQDLELWLRCFFNKIIVTQSVVEMRKHSKSITAKSSHLQIESVQRSVNEFLSREKVFLSNEEQVILSRIISGERMGSQYFVKTLIDIFQKLIDSKIAEDSLSKKYLHKIAKVSLRSKLRFYWKVKMLLKIYKWNF